jgi:superfamily II RNA helicase
MVLNLLESMRIGDVRELLSRSFMAWQKTRDKSDQALDNASRKNWKNFERHAAFLQKVGMVTDDFHLTDDGKRAAKLRLEHPLVLYEAIKQKGLPEEPELLAAVTASISEKPEDSPDWRGDGDGELKKHVSRFSLATERVRQMLKSSNFSCPHQSVLQARAVYSWASGKSFSESSAILGRGPGDLVRAALLTAEVLNQLSDLEEFYPDLSLAARRAVKLLMRPPVV